MGQIRFARVNIDWTIFVGSHVTAFSGILLGGSKKKVAFGCLSVLPDGAYYSAF